MRKIFAGRSVLITGAASGIGLASARRFANEGATLALGDINAGVLEQIASDLALEHGVTVDAYHYDAIDPLSCETLIDQAVSKMGKLDTLCNIAGVADWDHLTDVSNATWDRIIAINLNSIFYLIKRALPHLEKTQGSIVNMASAAGLVGLPYASAYSASKTGLVALTKSVAIEYASRRVRANAVCPGGIETPMLFGMKPLVGADEALIARMFPKLGRNGTVEEVAAAVSYLASDDALYITGAALPIDGGQSAG